MKSLSRLPYSAPSRPHTTPASALQATPKGSSTFNEPPASGDRFEPPHSARRPEHPVQHLPPAPRQTASSCPSRTFAQRIAGMPANNVLVMAAALESPKVLEWALDNFKADINAPYAHHHPDGRITDPGFSPLIAAIISGSPEKVQKLIEHGARADLPDGHGNFPLEVAKTMSHAHLVPILQGEQQAPRPRL